MLIRLVRIASETPYLFGVQKDQSAIHSWFRTVSEKLLLYRTEHSLVQFVGRNLSSVATEDASMVEGVSSSGTISITPP